MTGAIFTREILDIAGIEPGPPAWQATALSIIPCLSGYRSHIKLPFIYPPKNLEEKIVDVAEVHQRRCSEESGQWFENVDRTHLVLASG